MPVHSLTLPTVGTFLSSTQAPEDGCAHDNLLQNDRRFLLEEAEQLVHRWNLDVVDYKPASNPDVWEQVRELHLWQRVRMWSIKQHEVQFVAEYMSRESFSRFAFNKADSLALEIRMLTQFADGSIYALKGKRSVVLARVR